MARKWFGDFVVNKEAHNKMVSLFNISKLLNFVALAEIGHVVLNSCLIETTAS